MKIFKLTTLFVLLLFTKVSLAGNEGGGGDASEIRVNEIRSDILNWINNDGAKGLALPSELSYSEYLEKMTEILQAKKVVVEFTVNEVKVKETSKTCRGFISNNDSKPHILCNISRFQNTSESEQYKLIHHEYAGLVNVENNDGAASDYVVSSQITEFLTKQTVLKLAVKKNSTLLDTKWINISSCDSLALANLCTTMVQKMSFPQWTLGDWHSLADMASTQSNDFVFACFGTKIEKSGVRDEATLTGECDPNTLKARFLFGRTYTD